MFQHSVFNCTVSALTIANVDVASSVMTPLVESLSTFQHVSYPLILPPTATSAMKSSAKLAHSNLVTMLNHVLPSLLRLL